MQTRSRLGRRSSCFMLHYSTSLTERLRIHFELRIIPPYLRRTLARPPS